VIGAKSIREALKFPFEQDEWVGKAVIGSVLALGSLLVIPAPLLTGYLLRVFRSDSMPEFDNYLDMYIEGLKAFLVIGLYMMPGFAIMLAFDGFLLIVGALTFLIFYYAMESGLYHLANNGLRNAFSLAVLKDTFTLNYLSGVLIAALVNTALFIAWGFSTILILPVLLFPTVNFYQGVFRFRIMKEAIEAK
jgi:hypothetical protein